MRRVISFVLLTCTAALCQQPSAESQSSQPRLRTRDEVLSPPKQDIKTPWVIPAGTKIPLQLRQAISTKNAAAGDPVYAQTTFPIVIGGNVMIPAGTYVQGVVDNVKRAGRIKGTAELRFHLATLIYPNGYTLNMAAGIDQVPGSQNSRMKEPGTVKQDPEKGTDLERIGDAASKGAAIGAMAGATSGSVRGIGIGGLSGIAAGTLIAMLARGSDVRFEIGTGVEVALNQAVAVDADKAIRGSSLPASTAPAPVITMQPPVQQNR